MVIKYKPQKHESLIDKFACKLEFVTDSLLMVWYAKKPPRTNTSFGQPPLDQKAHWRFYTWYLEKFPFSDAKSYETNVRQMWVSSIQETINTSDRWKIILKFMLFEESVINENTLSQWYENSKVFFLNSMDTISVSP